MQAGIFMWQFNDTVQDAATGARKYGDINIFPTGKRVHAQYCVAMIALAIDGVAPVCEMRPCFICQIFKVRLVGIRKALSFGIALDGRAMNFLQEYDVCPGLGNTLAHALEHKTAIATAVALMDVVGQNVYIFFHIFLNNEPVGPTRSGLFRSLSRLNRLDGP